MRPSQLVRALVFVWSLFVAGCGARWRLFGSSGSSSGSYMCCYRRCCSCGRNESCLHQVEGREDATMQCRRRSHGVVYTTRACSLADAWSCSLSDKHMVTSSTIVTSIVPQLALECGESWCECPMKPTSTAHDSTQYPESLTLLTINRCPLLWRRFLCLVGCRIA